MLKKIQKYKILVICSFIVISLLLFIIFKMNTRSTSQEVLPLGSNSEEIQATLPASTQLDVPLIEQLEDPILYNGCEVTSLAMILNYNGINVTKNELSDAIDKVNFMDGDGFYGNPHEGFVGDIMGDEEGYGVYNEPIEKLLSEYVNKKQIHNISGKDFSEIQKALVGGQPVWVIITSNFVPTDDMEIWDTKTGLVEITYSMHSVVVTGYDQTSIYLNDPYGDKNYQTDKEDFINAWKQMGQQGIFITKN